MSKISDFVRPGGRRDRTRYSGPRGSAPAKPEYPGTPEQQRARLQRLAELEEIESQRQALSARISDLAREKLAASEAGDGERVAELQREIARCMAERKRLARS
jgi:hypothetical protein